MGSWLGSRKRFSQRVIRRCFGTRRQDETSRVTDDLLDRSRDLGGGRHGLGFE
jgi:hypothetical protein